MPFCLKLSFEIDLKQLQLFKITFSRIMGFIFVFLIYLFVLQSKVDFTSDDGREEHKRNKSMLRLNK